MVIVDVRPQTVGIPTDAYFAVEEIKDVRLPINSQVYLYTNKCGDTGRNRNP